MHSVSVFFHFYRKHTKRLMFLSIRKRSTHVMQSCINEECITVLLFRSYWLGKVLLISFIREIVDSIESINQAGLNQCQGKYPN